MLILNLAQFETNESNQNLSEENKETTNVSDVQQADNLNQNKEEINENPNLNGNDTNIDNLESKEALDENKKEVEEIRKENVENLSINNENFDNLKEDKALDSEINHSQLDIEKEQEKVVPEELKENTIEEKHVEQSLNKEDDLAKEVQEEVKENTIKDKIVEQSLNKEEDLAKEVQEEVKENTIEDKIVEQSLNKEDDLAKEVPEEETQLATEPNKQEENLKIVAEEKNTIVNEEEYPRETEKNDIQIINIESPQEIENIENTPVNQLDNVKEQVEDNKSNSSDDFMKKLINSEKIENEEREVQEKVNHFISDTLNNSQGIKLENTLDASEKVLNINTSNDGSNAKRDSVKENQFSEETKRLDESVQRNQKWRTTEKKIIEEGNTLMVAEKLEYKRGEVLVKETYVDDPDDKSAEPEKEKVIVKKLSLTNFQRNSTNLSPAKHTNDKKVELTKEDEEELFTEGEEVDEISEESGSVKDQEVQKVVLKLKINQNLMNKNESQDELLVGANAVPEANEIEPLPDTEDDNVAEAVDGKYHI